MQSRTYIMLRPYRPTRATYRCREAANRGLKNKRERRLSNSTRCDCQSHWQQRGKNAHDYPRRIGLRPRDARHGRERGSARCEMEKISAGKFHSEPPSRFTSLDHLVGDCEQLVGDGEPECLGGLEIDDKVEFGWL